MLIWGMCNKYTNKLEHVMASPLEESFNKLHNEFDKLRSEHEALKEQVKNDKHTKYFNDIRDFGPLDGRGNPETDNTEAIRQAIVDSNQNDMPIYIPGDAVIKETIEVPFQTGYSFLGSTSRQQINVNHRFDGPGSSITWDGEEGKAMFKIQGQNANIKDLSFFGKRWEQPSEWTPEGRAEIGILVTKPQRGMGTGKSYFQNLFCENCVTGIQFGENEEMDNCDVTSFAGTTSFNNCDNGMKVMNLMGMGYHMDMVVGYQVKNVFNFREGGGLEVGKAVVTGSSVESFIRTGKSQVNNSHFKIGMFKRDAQADNCQIVTMEERGVGKFLFDQIHTSMGVNRQGKPDFDLKGAPQLTIRGHNKLLAGSIVVTERYDGKNADRKARIIIDGCTIDAKDPRSIVSEKSDAPYLLQIRACHDWNGNAVEDMTIHYMPS